MNQELPEPLFRRGLRLLRAISLLHRQGYEELACTFFAGNEVDSWIVALCHIDNLLVDGMDCTAVILDESKEVYVHEQGKRGNEYFGWQDLKSASAEEIANAIKDRFAPLIGKCFRKNRENVGWFTQVLGHTEQDKKLPYASISKHYQKPSWVFQLGAPHFVGLPPAAKVFTAGDEKYYFHRVCYHKTKDWHQSHFDIINDISSRDLTVVPEYPRNWVEIEEMGAYWEGAVYFVFKHLRITSTQEFLLFLEGQRREYPMGDWFYRIYNSEGQLDHFIAFVVSNHLRKQQFGLSQLQLRWKMWLKFFEDKTHPAHTPSDSYLLSSECDPYYGGTNPLHLGMIFEYDEANWLNS
ncbi:hypothetical protein DXV75_16725 [Alteromonas aestuariivivens]|uniref:Uncharacterized protein n=1 Tax=Alteromonas aestuariivivens TaxID=1938339 RepID=A0A3D8M450_9ALTE|nr:hypothetical protein [Alteromonas aestuariivivens]RDV23912.1 hypothetical protein DXV75_16725 [Alteromonas aestuariivivens]